MKTQMRIKMKMKMYELKEFLRISSHQWSMLNKQDKESIMSIFETTNGSNWGVTIGRIAYKECAIEYESFVHLKLCGCNLKGKF